MTAPASDPAADLPADPDTDVVDAPLGPPTPALPRPASLALVFVGGTLGTAGREALTLLIPSSGGVPWAVLIANLAGAFALGALLEALARRGADHGRRRMLRLLLGTGFLGGFTTYSALATDTAVLWGAGAAGLGAVYAVGTVLVGAVATLAGILLAAALHRRRPDAAEASA
jgi:CrcB protein